MLTFLIGMPGSGKTHTAQQVAAIMPDYTSIDLDDIISSGQKQSISNIINTNGTDYFRAIEHNTLKETIDIHQNKNTIIATGGGTPCFYNNLELMKQSGITIYLDVSIDDILLRIKNDKERPLLSANSQKELKDKLNITLMERQKIYEQADFILKRGNEKDCNFAFKIKSIIEAF